MTEENVVENDSSIEEKTIVVDDSNVDNETTDKLVEALEKEDVVKEVIHEETQETNPESKEQIVKKKEVKLPPIGTKFMIAGDSYKVTWLNPGKHRFSAEPCEGQY